MPACLPRMNIYVYLHHPGQFYDSDSKTKIYVNQGKMLFIDLTYELSRVRVREQSILQTFRKRRRLGCAISPLATPPQGKFTQPSLHIFLPVCILALMTCHYC